MKVAALVIGAVLAAGAGATQALAQAHAGHSGHVVVELQDVKWGPGFPMFPQGFQAAVLYGDPTKSGQFALLLKLPKNYYIPPHTHPTAELATVISGRLDLGMGATADRSKTQAVSAGGFIGLPAGMEHYAYVAEDTVLQVNMLGPFEITYVNPKDDPRNKGK